MWRCKLWQRLWNRDIKDMRILNELVRAIAEECKTQEIMVRAIEAPYV